MKTITFYSYKGGVGRSLALSNIAIRLAEFKKKVCILDFDLEAPGIHYKFRNFTNLKNLNIKTGIVDYIHKFSVDHILEPHIDQYSYNLKPQDNLAQPIRLIPAGDIDNIDYWNKLACINWKDLFYGEDAKGLEFFLDLKSKIEKEFKPDYLLIDSRTGITDAAGITMRILADEVVILCANNEENIYGSKKVLKTLADPQNSLFDKKVKVHFVMTRLPFTDKDKMKESQIIHKTKQELDREIPNNNIDILVIHSDRRLEEKEIPLIGYEIEDKGVSISNDYLKLFDKLTEDTLSEKEKIRFSNVKAAERDFTRAKGEDEPFKKIELINSAIAHDPENWRYHYELAEVEFAKKNFIQAENSLNTVFQLFPNNSSGVLLKIQLLFAKNYPEEALILCQKMLQMEPGNFLFLFYKSISLELLGRLEEATACLTTILDRHSEFGPVLSKRADLYRRQMQLSNAYEDIRYAIELDPETAEYYRTLAEISAADNKTEDFYMFLSIGLSLGLTPETMKSAMDVYDKFLNDVRFQTLLEKFGYSAEELASPK